MQHPTPNMVKVALLFGLLFGSIAWPVGKPIESSIALPRGLSPRVVRPHGGLGGDTTPGGGLGDTNHGGLNGGGGLGGSSDGGLGGSSHGGLDGDPNAATTSNPTPNPDTSTANPPSDGTIPTNTGDGIDGTSQAGSSSNPVTVNGQIVSTPLLNIECCAICVRYIFIRRAISESVFCAMHIKR